MSQETFLDRLKKEQSELLDKISKLKSYIGTDHYNSLSVANKALLSEQLKAMDHYLHILNIRLELLDK